MRTIDVARCVSGTRGAEQPLHAEVSEHVGDVAAVLHVVGGVASASHPVTAAEVHHDTDATTASMSACRRARQPQDPPKTSPTGHSWCIRTRARPPATSPWTSATTSRPDTSFPYPTTLNKPCGMGIRACAAASRPSPRRRRDRWWVADFSYVWTLSGFCCVALLTDVYSRRILGRRVITSKTTPLVLSVLEQALFTRRAVVDRSGSVPLPHQRSW